MTTYIDGKERGKVPTTPTEGDIAVADSEGIFTSLAAGDATKVLTSNGAGSAPSWEAAAGGQTTVTYVVDAAGGGDYTDIKTAIDACTGGESIFIRKGNYTMDAAAIIDVDNIHIVGESWGTYITGSGDIALFNLQGNNIIFENLRIYHTGAGGDHSAIFYRGVTGKKNLTVNKCHLTKTQNAKILSHNYNATCAWSSVFITNNYITYGEIGIAEITGLIIEGNVFDAYSIIVNETDISSDIVICGNTFIGSGTNGISFEMSGTKNVSIIGNTFNRSTTESLFVMTSSKAISEVTISNNVCESGSRFIDCDQSSITNGSFCNNSALVRFDAIRGGTFTNVVITGNSFNTVSGYNTYYGITGLFTRCTIANNTLNNIGVIGIELDSGSAQTIVNGNVLADTKGTPTATYGILETTSDYNLISNNICIATFSNSYITLAGANSVAVNNITG